MTVIAMLVVGAVVLAASLLADREQVRPVTTRVVAPVPAAPARADRMEFTSDEGDGVLILTRREWTTTSSRRPTSTHLNLEVELVCTTGQIVYGPDNFSAFDARGNLFEVSPNARWGTPLGYGILQAGESVRGSITFALPRGEVTLLMSDSASRSVTALRVPV